MARVVGLILVVLFGVVLSADRGIELIHADKHIGKKVNDEQLRIFEGHVHFQQDTLHMWCDRAVMHEASEKIDFIGNVTIVAGKRTVRAERIEYYWKPRKAVCYQNVQIKSGQDSLFAQYLEYNFKTEDALARDDVYLFNSENKTHIWGQAGRHLPDENFSEVLGNAHLMKIDTAGGDTLHIFAEILQYFKQKEQKKAMAIDSVTIVQGNLKAVCDTAVYWVDEEKAVLRHQPQAWYEDNYLNAHLMKIEFDSLKLRKIVLIGQALAKSLADSTTGEENILKGKQIQFFVKNKKVERIIAINNASSLYYVTDESSEKGANYATADTIKIYFKTGKLDSIQIIGGARGTYYPEAFKKEIKLERP